MPESHCSLKAEAAGAARVIVLGCSGHARVVVDAIEANASYHVVGFLDSFKRPGVAFGDYTIVGTEDDLPNLWNDGFCNAVVLGIGDNWTRAQMAMRVQQLVPDVAFATVIHPSAQIAENVVIGDGTVIMAGVVVNTGTHIGRGCILNTRASFDHECTAGDFVSLGPGCVTGGGVEIGTCSAICIGAIVSHGIRVGKHSVIGASATVLSDIPDNVVAYGTPARVIRAREPNDRYL
jgi:sugar O-acyltransferase (sialic acid O-acetyltransferase NeuD family)